MNKKQFCKIIYAGGAAAVLSSGELDASADGELSSCSFNRWIRSDNEPGAAVEMDSDSTAAVELDEDSDPWSADELGAESDAGSSLTTMLKAVKTKNKTMKLFILFFVCF